MIETSFKSSARQTMHMKCQSYFIGKQIRLSSAIILLSALRVKLSCQPSILVSLNVRVYTVRCAPNEDSDHFCTHLIRSSP